MPDREKVIEALEACVLKDPDDSRDCRHCPRCNYGAFITTSCINGVMADALALLKAQEPAYVEERLVLDKLSNIQDYARVNEINWMADGAAYAETVIGALQGRISALLKAQEPKPVHVTAEINYRKIGECPNCSNVINSGDYPNYCGKCGQAVKWE